MSRWMFLVVGHEGRLGPVGLDAAALRGPVLRRLDAGVGVHGPARWVRHAVAFLVVAEHTDGDAVNVPPACAFQVTFSSSS